MKGPFLITKCILSRGIESENNFLSATLKDYESTQKGWGMSMLYVELGKYFEQVKRFFNTFNKDQIFLILYEDWRFSNEDVLGKLFKFLGIERISLPRHNKNTNKLLPRMPLMHWAIENSRFRYLQRRILPEKLRSMIKLLWYSRTERYLGSRDRKLLLPYFIGDIVKLEELTGFDLSAWKQSEVNSFTKTGL